MELQIILNGYQNIEKILHDKKVKNCFIVHGHSFESQEAFAYLKDISQQQGIQLVQFSGYTSNPKIEEVQAGVALFEQTNCDFIIAVGGGSAIDVAKCIKQHKAYVKMLAIPTTAGTGSESTQFAVVYENGEKKSVDDVNILPDYVILDAGLLRGLPLYQRKATMLDALCQAIESIWAKRATTESQQLAVSAIRMIMDCYQQYLDDIPEGNEQMLKAANLAGQAINITRTTAAHAMSYKITSLFGAAHGHAVAICLLPLWKRLLEAEDISEDTIHALQIIAEAMGYRDDMESACYRYEQMLNRIALPMLRELQEQDLKLLVPSVNIQRLSNHPMELSENDLESIYLEVLKNR